MYLWMTCPIHGTWPEPCSCSDTRPMPDASEADPYAAVCLLARKRGWRVLLAIEFGDPPHTSSRLSALSLVDAKGDVRGFQPVKRSLEDTALTLLAKLARTEAA